MNTRPAPFLLIPWRAPFLPGLLRLALEDSAGRLEECLFIFPHARPIRYMTRLIRLEQTIPKPCLPPHMLPVNALFEEILAEKGIFSTPAGLLDQIGLLLACVREEELESPEDGQAFPIKETADFFPWGARLAALFEECFIHNRDPADLPGNLDPALLEDELRPFAARLISRLARLYRRYAQGLAERQWSTPGLTAKQAAQAASQDPEPALFQARHIYLAGFCSPSGSEEIIFKLLWQKYGAKVVIHADPDLDGENGHWSCAELRAWMQKWSAPKPSLLLYSTQEAANAGQGPEINFYNAYDAHSQLAAMQKALKDRLPGDTALILPDASLLAPVLHHLDERDVNISMGYPLASTSLNRFLQGICALHERSRPGGQYRQDCIRLLRHPYVKMLGDTPEAETAPGKNLWRSLLLQAENALRQGRRYVRLPLLLQELAAQSDSKENLEKLQPICELFKLNFIELWEQADDLRSLALVLENLCSLLLRKGEALWSRFPLDAECLYRFTRFLLPELKNSALSREKLPQAALFAIFRELAQAGRVPFEADPLTAVQIMGLLESRLLNFHNVFILDATEDLLPGVGSEDPLLPDSLRPGLGLPGHERRASMQAYYFYRLIQGAEKVSLFWPEGVETRGLQDAKKLRSRFVEELIWQTEQKLGRLLNAKTVTTKKSFSDAGSISLPMRGDGPLHIMGSVISPLRVQRRSLEASPPARARCRRILSRPLSATRLNSYLRCPAAFYYGEIAALSPLAEAREHDDPLAVGELLHQALRDFYQDKLQRPLRREELDEAELSALFLRALAGDEAADLPPDAKAMLKISGPRHLAAMLQKQPPETTVRALELPLRALLSADGFSFQLHGRLDRLDERRLADGSIGAVILDYKTGSIHSPEETFWSDLSIWKHLREGTADTGDAGLFLSVAEGLKDVQLPLYMYLAAFGAPEEDKARALFPPVRAPRNAAWVDLRGEGKEIWLFPPDLGAEEAEDRLADINLLLEYILLHLARAQSFAPRAGDSCRFCEFREICIVL